MKVIALFLMVAIAIAAFSVFGFSGNVGNNSALAAELPDTSFVKADSSKIDLNNANIYAFRKLPGFYPNLGRIIIDNAPYDSLDDVLNIPGLTGEQRQRIQENADKFSLFKPDNSMNRERINNSTYRL